MAYGFQTLAKGLQGLQSCIKLRINEDTHAVQINMPAIFTKSNLLETSVASIAPAGDSGNSVGSLIEIPPAILPTDVGVVAGDPESITMISSSFIQPNLYDDSSDSLVSSANDLKHLEEKFCKLEKANNEWLRKKVTVFYLTITKSMKVSFPSRTFAIIPIWT